MSHDHFAFLCKKPHGWQGKIKQKPPCAFLGVFTNSSANRTLSSSYLFLWLLLLLLLPLMFCLPKVSMVTVIMCMCQKCFTVLTFPISLQPTPIHTLSASDAVFTHTDTSWHYQLNPQELDVYLPEYASLGTMCFVLNCWVVKLA